MRFVKLVTLVALVVMAGQVWAEEGLPRSVYVAPAEVKEWQEEGREILFLDVREKDEFEAGHLAGAVNIAYTEVPGMAGTLPKDRAIVTYCIHSAHRAPEAAKGLRGLGFSNAYVLEGGIVAWQAGGMTIRAGDLAKEPTILPVSERCRVKKG